MNTDAPEKELARRAMQTPQQVAAEAKTAERDAYEKQKYEPYTHETRAHNAICCAFGSLRRYKHDS